MTERFPEIFDAATIRLDYAGLKAGDQALIIADSGTHEPLLDAVYSASVALGADVTVMKFRAREQPFNWELPPLLEHAIYNADFTFSLLHPMWYYNASSMRVQGHMHKTGKRMGSWEGRKEAAGHFVALMPGDRDVTERTRIVGKLLGEAKIIRITSRD